MSVYPDDAACKGKPMRLFFPGQGSPVGLGGGSNYDAALALCAVCPVIDACRAWAIQHGDIDAKGRAVFGAIAGVAPETKRIGRPTGPTGRPAARREHGTHAGYQQHRRLKEAACEECKLAHARHNFQRYQSKKAM